jgi:photosystem II stability/assembly factor-like uncharacterized protein
MKKVLISLMLTAISASYGRSDLKYWEQVELPESYSASHVLSITVKGNQILLGTYGRGAFLTGADGTEWTVFDTTKGLSWDFILGGDWKDDYIILATLGDGVNISTDGGKKWERYGYNFFGVEYLYTVGAAIEGGLKYVPTADGLVVFDSVKDWHSITENNGLASQYIYDMMIRGDTIALGTLHGYSISYDRGSTWSNLAPNGKFTVNKLAACKVRAVAFEGTSLYAGCDDGLYVSRDKGQTWARSGAGKLTSEFVHDLVFDGRGDLWVASYKEIGRYSPDDGKWQLFNTRSGLPPGSINCLGITQTGEILAGTNHGLFRLTDKKPGKARGGRVDATFFKTEKLVHQWMLRPIGPDDQNCKDQTYLYGSTMGGNFRQHQGNEYNNPEGVPIRAVDSGVIVFTNPEIGHSVLRCDTKTGDNVTYAHYHHQNQILKQVGDRVMKGDTIGTIGKKGNVTNEHLHFEVAFTEKDSQTDVPTHTRNSELWVEPLPGCGTIVGSLVDAAGVPVPGARIYGVTKPIPTETPFSFAETYRDKVHPDETYDENFAIGDVPAGDYVIYANADDRSASVKVRVEAGKFTRVKLQLK